MNNTKLIWIAFCLMIVSQQVSAKRAMPTKSKCFENTKNGTHILINLDYYPSKSFYGTVAVFLNNAPDPTGETGVTGTDSSKYVLASFNNTPPNLGENIQWTKGKWILTYAKNKEEMLSIPILLQNNKTHKWKTVFYKFKPCKD